jgi:hypothetical protein
MFLFNPLSFPASDVFLTRRRGRTFLCFRMQLDRFPVILSSADSRMTCIPENVSIYRIVLDVQIDNTSPFAVHYRHLQLVNLIERTTLCDVVIFLTQLLSCCVFATTFDNSNAWCFQKDRFNMFYLDIVDTMRQLGNSRGIALPFTVYVNIRA